MYCPECNSPLLNLLDVSVEDLNVASYPQYSRLYQDFLAQAENDKELQKLFKALGTKGIAPKMEDVTVRTITFPIDSENPSNNPVVTQVLYGAYKKDINVGGVVYTTGQNDNQIFSVTQKGKSDVHDIYYVENGKIEHLLVKDGEVLDSSAKIERMKDKVSTDEVTTQDITCMGVCGAICGTGLGSQLLECVRGCRLYGPAYFWCLALCSVIIGAGCVVGCDAICDLF